MRSLLLVVAYCSTLAHAAADAPSIAVVTIPDIEAYAQTLAGIREQLPDVQVLDARDEARLRDSLAKRPPALAIALGSSAALALEHVAPAQLPLVYAVVLECDLEADGGKPLRFRAAVTVDIPPDVLLAEIARLFPGKSRIGLIRGPMQTAAYIKSVEQAARRAGLSVEIAPCRQPRDLVDVFLSLRSRVDLVWCPPNVQLYNSATLKPLLVASLTNRLPIIGFSDQFVQAGALFGGTADFLDLGRQAAALALQIGRNEAVPARQPARKFHFAYNQRVARILGVKAGVAEGAGLSIIR